MRLLSVFALTISILVVFCGSADATPCWDQDDYQRYQKTIETRTIEGRIDLHSRQTDRYSLIYEYVQICDFLVTMQESDPLNPDFGGMHEGETPDLWAIVQTDNTQEAIRVWSSYAEISGDLETYRDNIAAAWTYTMNYPAYDEEGSESDYYRVHNCGWGLVAETKYREMYNDSGYLWYADSCAAFIQTHRLAYTGYTNFYNDLHPLVEGWAAGTLYDYGIEQGSQAAVDHALDVGLSVQMWIGADPDRLATNEVWAMSGGTAMWGVCRSLYAADPSAGQIWLPTVISHMDTYAGSGEWNNSHNVWYAHAYHAVAAVMSDPQYTGFAFALVDTLLDADTDNDGGIMATSTDPETADQSWVSCYLDYMGMEYLINELPDWDAAALDYILPDTLLPIGQGEAVQVSVSVGNSGFNSFGDLNIQISGAFNASASTYLDFADVDTVEMGQWTPANPGWTELIMTITPGGELTDNDTLHLPVQVLGWGAVAGYVTDTETGLAIGATLHFYREGIPSEEPMYSVNNDPVSGDYQIDVLEGTYKIVIDPEIPYTDRESTGIIVDLGQTTNVDFTLHPAPVLLVDDDGEAQYDTCFSLPLEQSGFDVYIWDVNQNGEMTADIVLFEAAVWMTGDETEDAITQNEQDIIISYLDTGGNLFITGQNIAENLTGEPFLNDYLGASFEDGSSGQQQVLGVNGDPVTSGLMVMFPGSGGANNQTSTDIITATGSGESAMLYSSSMDCAGVHVDLGYKSLFLSFGLEGVSGAAGSTNRYEFLQAVMDWFGVPPTGVSSSVDLELPNDYSLLRLIPNPFNPELTLKLAMPHTAKVEIRIYNVRGQLIEFISPGMLTAGSHNIGYRFDVSHSSGVYYFVLQGRDIHSISRGVLIK